ALNQLLVVMDGIDNPPFFRRMTTNLVNKTLDALYVIPRRAGRVKLRLRQAKPSGNQIYFIGATNVPMEMLDPALTRPGRIGRHAAAPRGRQAPPLLAPAPNKPRPRTLFPPLPGGGPPRAGPRPQQAPRRARARDQRVLARHDRASLLDGAHDRAPRRAARLP